MSYLQLCGMSLHQMRTRLSINHQWIELWRLCQCASLCMEQYAWIHAKSSKVHAEWLFYPSNYRSHILERSTWLDRTMPYLWNSNYLEDYGSSLATGSSSYFHSAMLVTTSWSCFVPLGHHWFHPQSLLRLLALEPSHPGPATFCPCQTHSLVLTWFLWNYHVNGVCCLDPMPLQITMLCALHSV